MKQFDTITLIEDLNPVIREGMEGVILEIYDNQNIEAEFVKSDGTNWSFDNSYTFAVPVTKIKLIEAKQDREDYNIAVKTKKAVKKWVSHEKLKKDLGL